MKTKIYLSGPLRDSPSSLKENFEIAQEALGSSASTITALEHYNSEDDYENPEIKNMVMKQRLDSLMKCDRLILLPGWETDLESIFEKKVADFTGIPHYTYDEYFKNHGNESPQFRNESTQVGS
jgi:hypothetical protein